jgi:quercetin dioxygenase-like cupin family protein
MKEKYGKNKGKPILLKKTISYSKSSIVSKTFIDKKTGTLTLFSFAKGQRLSEHTAPYDATVLIVEGVAEVTIGGKPIIAKAGEMVIMPAKVPHSVKAIKAFKMLLIMIREM